jgi:hypothetical protein
MSRSKRMRAPSGAEPEEQGISAEEREARAVVQLPEREALSVAFPLAGPLSLGGVGRDAEAVGDSMDDAAIDPTPDPTT